MNVHEFVCRSEMPVPSSVLFAWHAAPGALGRLLPPWEDVQVRRSSGGIENGGRVELSVPVGPLRIRWVAEHDEFHDGQSFRDVQSSGPFLLWEHTHRCAPAPESRSVLEDCIRYALPLGVVGDRLGETFVRRRLGRLFAFRHERTRFDLLAHERAKDSRLMKILVSGARGLVGSELSAFLTAGGHDVVALTRRDDPQAVHWSPAEGTIETDKLEGFDAVIHLAGENILGRWNARKKQAIRDSRLQGTRLLCDALAAASKKPDVVVSMSATGYYGSRGDEVLTESSEKGTGFLADVCQEWEEACEPARQAGIRVVNIRSGPVLSPKGGMLGTLLPLFKSGMGGPVGNGRQWIGWIAIDDLVDVLHAAMTEESLAGPVNATAPNPVTNAEFARTLARVLKRPDLIPVPSFAVRIALGQAADETALASQRVVPERLQHAGHHFRYPTLEEALRFLLGRPKPAAPDTT